MWPFLKRDSLDLFFGEYRKPPLLEKLEAFQSDGGSWESLGFYINYDHHYSITPLDVIPFAGTGGDGIHFGFLTDFGRVRNLEDAPIVCVSPSNDPPLKLVANDLKEFLQVVSAIGNAEFLDSDYHSQEEIKSRLEEWDKVSEKDWKGDPLPKDEIEESKNRLQQTVKERIELRRILKNDLGITEIPSVVSYIQKLRDLRKNEINIPTCDDIGIIHSCDNQNIVEYEYQIKNPTKIKNFLKSASLCSKLRFYRDVTYQFILSEDYDREIKRILIKQLKKEGFVRESRILDKKYA